MRRQRRRRIIASAGRKLAAISEHGPISVRTPSRPAIRTRLRAWKQGSVTKCTFVPVTTREALDLGPKYTRQMWQHRVDASPRSRPQCKCRDDLFIPASAQQGHYPLYAKGSFIFSRRLSASDACARTKSISKIVWPTTIRAAVIESKASDEET